jgi:hypothetical protein
MRSRTFKFIGFSLSGLVFLELFLQVVIGLTQGLSFYGENYYWQPLGTYEGAAVLIVLTVGAISSLYRLIARRSHKHGRSRRASFGTT